MGLLKSLGVSCTVALGQSSRKLTALEAVRLVLVLSLTGEASQRIDFLLYMFVNKLSSFTYRNSHCL